jgi:multidrug efflux pump subunit AcrB
MNLVSFALRRPTSLLIAVAAVALAGFLALDRMSRDIFPDLGVPVLYVAQPYGGLDPAEMEGFITNYYEYHFLYITGIEHVESKSIQGVALIKLQFHPGTNMAQATAETVSYVDRARAFMPNGTVPPFVMRFDAGGVPVGDLVFSSKTKTVAELQDAALFRVRPLFATLPGASAPPPFGSSQRTILVRLDPGKLRSYNMSPDGWYGHWPPATRSAPPGTSASAICGLRYWSTPLSGISKASTTFRSARRERRRFSSATSDRSKTVPTFRPDTRSSTVAAPYTSP